MARLVFATAPGVEVGFEYTATNNKVTAVYCVNTSGHDVEPLVTLTTGQVFSQRMPPGDLTFAVPNNAITYDPVAENLPGLASIAIRSY